MFSFFNKNRRLLKQAEKGNTQAVLRLLANSTDEDGFSPLIEALRWEHQDTAEDLISAGADVHARTLIFHETALKLAHKDHHSETAELLRPAGASE